MSAIKSQINSKDIRIGEPLPFSAYDKSGLLLLKKDTIVNSQKQLDALLRRGLYRENVPEVEEYVEEEPESLDPFESIGQLSYSLERLFIAVKNHASINVEQQVMHLAESIQKLCDLDTDAVLGAVHLRQEASYAINRTIQTAVFCEIVARKLKRSEQQRAVLLAGALTSNIAFWELQNKLYRQKELLTASQKEKIESHSSDGVRLLRSAGVTHALWLKIVMQHHEKVDGSGYPAGLKRQEIAPAAKVVALSDRYGAAISPRAYRRARVSKDMMRDLSVNKGKEYDATLCVLFNKELGIYPPGSFVRLNNGETAVVTHRGRDSMKPRYVSVLDSKGELFLNYPSRNTGSSDHEIQGMCFLEETNFLNLHKIWGYKTD